MIRVLVLSLALLSPAAIAGSIEQAIQKPGRLEGDIERDARSKPQAVLPLLKLEWGDRVADVFGGSGYYSELLAAVVGADGEVILQNNRAYLQFAAEGTAACLAIDAGVPVQDLDYATLRQRLAADRRSRFYRPNLPGAETWWSLPHRRPRRAGGHGRRCDKDPAPD